METIQRGFCEMKGMLLPPSAEATEPGRRAQITNLALTTLAVFGAALLAVTLFEPVLIVLAVPAAILLAVTLCVSKMIGSQQYSTGSWGGLMGRPSYGNSYSTFWNLGGSGPRRSHWWKPGWGRSSCNGSWGESSRPHHSCSRGKRPSVWGNTSNDCRSSRIIPGVGTKRR